MSRIFDDEKPGVSNWQDWAECAKYSDTELALAWIEEEHPGKSVAKKVCNKLCAVREFCLADAVVDPNAIGIRAGYEFENGALTAPDVHKLAKEIGIRVRLRHRHTTGITNGGE